MKKIRFVIAGIAVLALFAVGFLSARLLDKNSAPAVSATSIEQRLSKCSSLTTARLDYRGMVKYSDGDIQFLTQKSFSMIYDAHIKAGIDLSQTNVSITGNTIQVSIPAPEIQDISIDSDSLEFYDEKLALFNWTDKEDTAKAIEFAKENAREKATLTDMLTQASDHAKLVIETLLQPITDDNTNQYKLVVKVRK